MKRISTLCLFLFLLAIPFINGCGIVPTYTIPPTVDVVQVIAETAAVELTRIAIEDASAVTEMPVPMETATPAAIDSVDITPTETPRPKDIALLLGTLSMGPGSQVFTGEQFHVTWRLRNIGETDWDDTFSLVHVSGESFGQAESIPLSVSVVPGELIDLTLVLTAPEMTGIHRGEWLISAPDGTLFGVGYEDPQPLVVDVVADYNPVDLGKHQLLQFFDAYSAAEWRDQHGPAFCSAEGNVGVHGHVVRQNEVFFEGEIHENEPTLIMRPAQGEGGFIEGIFPPYLVTAGNYFTTRVGCLADYHRCDVSLKIYIQVVGESSVDLYWEGTEQYDDAWVRIHKPLEKYRGKEIVFIFRVENNGDATDDVIGWFAPVILH